MRSALLVLLAWTWLSAQTPGPPHPTLALTFDDGPNRVETPRLSPEARNHALLETLRKEQVQAIIFANGIAEGDTPAGRAALAAWGRAGHLVGNHTYSHLQLGRVDLGTFKADFLRCDRLIQGLPGYVRLFRFPYLKEGDTLARRDGMRKILSESGYHNAPVTIPTFDWLIDEHLRTRLNLEPSADLAPYRSFYVEQVLEAADEAQALGLKLAGREIPHTLLLHHCLLNALFLGDLIGALRRNGWTLIAPRDAYRDPFFEQAPQSLNSGTSLLQALAAERGLPLHQSPGLEQAYEVMRRTLREQGL